MNIFISYSRKDYEWVSKIRTHLVPFFKSEELVLFSDMDILPGQDWNAQVKRFLESADIAILLISPSYLASDFICNIEFPSLLQAAQGKHIKIIPILIKETLLEGEILNWQFLNQFSQPLASLPETEQEVYLHKLFKEIQGLTRKADTRVGKDVKQSGFDRAIQSALVNTGNINLVVSGDGNVFNQAERKVGNH